MKDLAGIGKVIKTVGDAVRGAAYTLYRPTAIRKEGRARAEVKAYEIEVTAAAKARAALIQYEGKEAIAARARQRFIFEQVTQQEAIESTFQKAIEYAAKKGKEKGRKIDEHWLYRLMINCKDVTDEDVQEIFAKLIVRVGISGDNT